MTLQMSRVSTPDIDVDELLCKLHFIYYRITALQFEHKAQVESILPKTELLASSWNRKMHGNDNDKYAMQTYSTLTITPKPS